MATKTPTIAVTTPTITAMLAAALNHLLRTSMLIPGQLPINDTEARCRAAIITSGKPRNRRRADVVAAPDLGKRFLALVAALDRFFLLVRGELGRSAHFLTPRATARARPSPVRARIRSRSNSASPPSTVSISRPCDVVVSAHVSPSERKPAFLAVIAARVFNRSRVDRASRSSRVTVSTSPASSWSSNRRSCARSVLAPLTPLRGTPFCIRPWSVAAPGRQRSGRRSIPLHSRISCLTYGGNLCKGKAFCYQRPNFFA